METYFSNIYDWKLITPYQIVERKENFIFSHFQHKQRYAGGYDTKIWRFVVLYVVVVVLAARVSSPARNVFSS